MYYCTLSHRVGTDERPLGLYRLDITKDSVQMRGTRYIQIIKDQVLVRGMELSPIHMVKV